MKTLATALVMATSLGTPAFAEPTIPEGYTFINYNSETYEIFYGKIRSSNGNERILALYSVEEDNKVDRLIRRINCKQRTMFSSGKWKTFPKEKLGYDWIEFACKSSKLWKP